MDYSNYASQQSQPYSMYGLPTPDHQPQPHNDDALRDPFSLVRHLPYLIAMTDISWDFSTLTSLQNTYDQYVPGFDPSLRLDPSTSLVAPPPHSPPDSFTKHSISSNDVRYGSKPDPVTFDGEENQFADAGMGRSSSEEKESATPAQSKRKAQNRAAYVIFTLAVSSQFWLFPFHHASRSGSGVARLTSCK